MEFSDTSFIDMEQGWALLGDTLLFQTKDGGGSWTELPRLKQTFRNIQFVSLLRGWGIAQDGLYTTDDGGQSWTRILDAPFSGWRPAMEFVNEKRGFLQLETGLNRTSDGGKTWEILHPQAFSDLTGDYWGLSSISFVNEMKGWVLYRGCNMPFCRMMLFKTEDGGETFYLVSDSGADAKNGSMNFMRPGSEVFFLDDHSGWFVGNQYGFQSSGDGGKTWKSERLPSGFYSINRIQMFTPNDGVAIGWDEISGRYRGVMKTRDGGKTWAPLLPALQPYRFVRFLDADHGFGIGGFLDPLALLVTENGGKSWKKMNALPKAVHQLQFLNPKTAWAGVGEYFENNQDYLWRTDDGGMTWKAIPFPPGFRAQDFFFSDAESGIAWDYQKNALQTLDGGKTWLSLKPDQLSLPLPNPDCHWAQVATEIYHSCSGSTGWGSVLKWSDIRCFIPVSGNAAWVLGQKEAQSPQTLLRTADGGKTWEPIKIARASFQDLTFIDLDQGWAISGPLLFKTTDGGNSWQQMEPGLP